MFTAEVVTVNVAEVAPAATVTLAGTAAAAVLLPVSVTTAPPTGAAALKTTVPVEKDPPTTRIGLTCTEDKAAPDGITVSTAVWTPLKLAESVTCVDTLTAEVVTVNVAELAPEGTVTPEGLVADDDELLESETRTPPAGANPFSATVAVAEVPPVTLVGFMLKDDTASGGGLTCGLPPPPAQPDRKKASE